MKPYWVRPRLPTKRERRQWKTSVHEAGHCVVAHQIGIFVYEAKVKHNPGEDSRGFVRVRAQRTPSRQRLHKWMLLSLAGYVAEKIHISHKDKVTQEVLQVWRLAQGFFGTGDEAKEQGRAFFRETKETTYALLENISALNATHRIAISLYSRKRLTGAQVRLLLRGRVLRRFGERAISV